MSLDFVNNYQRIRQKFYAPRPEPVSPPKFAPVERKIYVYAYPIGPVKPIFLVPPAKEPGEETFRHTGKRVADQILKEVCVKHNVTETELLSDRRPKRLTDIRQELYFRLATETTWSLPRIGKYLGGRDHTTILHGKRRYEERLMLGEVTR